MFLDNKYSKWYSALTNMAVNRTEEFEGEKHHIVPRSLGGLDTPGNVVKLTYREHFLAHWLLTKMTTGDDLQKMRFALHYMRRGRKGKITSWQYEVGKRAVRAAMYGIPKTERQKIKISRANKGKKRTPEMVMRISEASRGRKHSEETKAKMSAYQKVKQKNKTDKQKQAARDAGRAMRGTHMPEEAKLKISLAQKRAWENGRKMTVRGTDGKFVRLLQLD